MVNGLTMVVVIILTLCTMIVTLTMFPTLRMGKLTIQTYWLITLLGASIVWGLSGFSLSFLQNAIAGEGGMNPMRILGLFFSFTTLAIFLDEVVLIRDLAYLAIHRAGFSQRRMFMIWYGLVALATMVTANDIVILTLTPFIIYFARHAKIHPLPYLMAQFVSANVWSMMFVIGNPTNIYVASQFGLGFLDYVSVMAIPTLIVGTCGYGLLYLVFHRHLNTQLTKPDLLMNPPHPSYRPGVVMLIGAIILMMLSEWLGLGMDQLTIISVLILVIWIKITYPRSGLLLETFKRLPYALIPFFISMMVLVQGLTLTGLTSELLTTLETLPSVYGYGISSFLFSNAMNNIPMTIWFTEVIALQTIPSLVSMYATIIGSNLGALLTPIGALAGLMWMTILKNKQVQISFFQFVLYGCFFGGILLSIALMSLDVIL